MDIKTNELELTTPAIAQNSFKQVLNRIEKTELELNLIKFELIYSSFVPKPTREEYVKSVRGIRDECWEKAMKEAKGDEIKAIKIYNKLIRI